jgi:SPP1 family phage portal protein
MDVSAYEKENVELLGRKRIYTDVDRITAKNVISVLQDALSIHKQNVASMAYLLRYEKGVQPLQRKKEIRKDINIEVVDNIANQITEFKLGYNWGNPITYVQRGNRDISGNQPNKDDDAVSILNEMNEEEAAFAKDQELARYLEICGIGYQMVDIKREKACASVFDLFVPNPLYAFVVYRNNIAETPMMGVTYRTLKNGDSYYTCITDSTRYEIRNVVQIVDGVRAEDTWEFNDNRPGYEGEKNPFGKVPIVEFVRSYDRMGCFERQIPDMDALNIEVSDFANSVAQNTQEIWWGNDFEFPKNEDGSKKRPKSGQWLMTKTLANGTKPLIKPLSSTFDYGGVQANIESKRNTILQKCYVPLQTDPGGGSTANAMSLSSGWSAAENHALKEEQIIRRSKMMVLDLELVAISIRSDWLDGSPVLDLKLSDVVPKFTRLKTYDLGTKTNAMIAMIKTGINGRVAMQTVDLFPDVAQAWNDSREMIEKFQESIVKKDEPQSVPDDREMSDQTDQTGNSPILDGMNMSQSKTVNGGDGNG